jgi:hypothetical protein
MEVLNIHERELDADAVQIGALIDTLASKEDLLWPKHIWPHMDFDRSLGVGAKGGHGPIRYFIEEYTPGISIKFRFTGPKGFNGFHGYEIVRCPKQKVVLRHTLKMNTYGPAILSCYCTNIARAISQNTCLVTMVKDSSLGCFRRQGSFTSHTQQCI